MRLAPDHQWSVPRILFRRRRVTVEDLWSPRHWNLQRLEDNPLALDIFAAWQRFCHCHNNQTVDLTLERHSAGPPPTPISSFRAHPLPLGRHQISNPNTLMSSTRFDIPLPSLHLPRRLLVCLSRISRTNHPTYQHLPVAFHSTTSVPLRMTTSLSPPTAMKTTIATMLVAVSWLERSTRSHPPAPLNPLFQKHPSTRQRLILRQRSHHTLICGTSWRLAMIQQYQ